MPRYCVTFLIAGLTTVVVEAPNAQDAETEGRIFFEFPGPCAQCRTEILSLGETEQILLCDEGAGDG